MESFEALACVVVAFLHQISVGSTSGTVVGVTRACSAGTVALAGTLNEGLSNWACGTVVGCWAFACNASVVAFLADKLTISLWDLVVTILTDTRDGPVRVWVYHSTFLTASSAVTPSWSRTGTAVWIAGWDPFSVYVVARLGSDVFAVVSWFWMADTVVDGQGQILKAGTISATSTSVPFKTIAVKTFWVAFRWEALVGRWI